MDLYPALQEFIKSLNFQEISEERKATLQPLMDYLTEKRNVGGPIRLNFICTHNSRRSHLSQVWAQTLAHYYGIQNLVCYSGGTEATVLFPKVTEVLKEVGFRVQQLSVGNNPIYGIKYSENEPAIIGFSKGMDHEFNPVSAFAAIMTCSQADEGCPFVPGAEKRFPITYEDPKAYDGTPLQHEKYQERSRQIATELCYVFYNIKA